jgi:uncharacterized protein YkwD
MFRFLLSSLALVLIGSPVPVKDADVASARTAAASLSSPADSSAYDSNAEREFLRLANTARAQAGLSPLQADADLIRAARTHTAAMIRQHQLSHQFPGEPALMQRLMTNTNLHLDHAGENVGYSGSVAQAHDGFMHSPPHRENLLDPVYNVAGMGVMWDGSMLYVTQDFAHSLPTYSAADAEEALAASVSRTRRNADLKALQRMEYAAAATVACAMAKADSINVTAPRDHTILRYTAMRPEDLPGSATRMIVDPRIQGFAVGICYARTATYPSGVYWVALILY